MATRVTKQTMRTDTTITLSIQEVLDLLRYRYAEVPTGVPDDIRVFKDNSIEFVWSRTDPTGPASSQLLEDEDNNG